MRRRRRNRLGNFNIWLKDKLRYPLWSLGVIALVVLGTFFHQWQAWLVLVIYIGGTLLFARYS